jgi:hypothetical protein
MELDVTDRIAELRALCQAATVGPWEFRATEHSGGIRFVVAPAAPRNNNGTEFIPADCSHGYNGRFIATFNSQLVSLLLDVAEAARKCTQDFRTGPDGVVLDDDLAVALDTKLAALEAHT